MAHRRAGQASVDPSGGRPGPLPASCQPSHPRVGWGRQKTQPLVGRRPVPRPLGARFSAFPFQARGPAPGLGEHNREVLQGLLRVSDEELRRLEEEKVIGTEPELAWGADVARQVLPMPLHSFQQMGAVLTVEADYREQLGIKKE